VSKVFGVVQRLECPVVDDTPPAINTSLPVPIELVELASNHLVLRSHWSAPYRFLVAAPFSIRGLALTAGPTVLAFAGAIDSVKGQVVVRSPTFALVCTGVALVGAVRTLLLVTLSWATMRWRRGGPIECDRSRGRLVFGPRTEHLTFPLNSIAGVQLVEVASPAASSGVWEAITADRSPLGYLLKWAVARTKTYQLNLMLHNEHRLNLANWRNCGQPEQQLTRQLAEFLGVPLEDHGLTGDG
jgi:hypothetical protein